MDEIIMEAKGLNGQIAVLSDKIRIKRKGVLSFLTQGLKGEKGILISQISSIQFRQAGLVANGYIQFAFVGGQEAKGGLFEATQDENSVMFNYWQKEAFNSLRAAIEQRMAAINVSGKASMGSSLDELEKLATLRDKGIIPYTL